LRRRLDRQLAGDGVERSRHGQRDRLIAQRKTLVRVRRFPAGADLAEDAGLGVERRDPGRRSVRSHREELRASVHAGMGEPALRRADESPRDLTAALAGVRPHDEFAELFVARRQVDERREQLARRHFLAGDHL